MYCNTFSFAAFDLSQNIIVLFKLAAYKCCGITKNVVPLHCIRENASQKFS